MGLFDKPSRSNVAEHTDEKELPFLAVSDLILFPGHSAPLSISNQAELRVIDRAMASGRRLVLGFFKEGKKQGSKDDLLPLGVEIRLLQVMKLPNSVSRVLVEALGRVEIRDIRKVDEAPSAVVVPLTEDSAVNEKVSSLMRALQDGFEQYSRSNKRIPKELAAKVRSIENPQRLVDQVAGFLAAPSPEKQKIFLEMDPLLRLETTAVLLQTEQEVYELRKSISDRVKKKMEDNQKEYFLNEQIKEMNRELGKEEDDASGMKELEARLEAKLLPEEAAKKARAELKRLGRLQAFSPEAGILRTYIEWILDLPWYLPEPGIGTSNTAARNAGTSNAGETGVEEDSADAGPRDNTANESSAKANTKTDASEALAVGSPAAQVPEDETSGQDNGGGGGRKLAKPTIEEAEEILEADHFGLDEAKDRVLDYIAVASHSRELKAPILCFVGPPGTGKTSLARSLARAMGRNFVRISLGGVRDEAEVRGHRRTYVGALPGKIIQGMKKADSPDPVFLLDEIDKISQDHRGDPASALLEVLDPEQNANFVDHYLEIPFDLSRVVFITTANSLHTIPYPLRDRMEVIQIPGYTENEKKNIAQQFLIPRQAKAHGLDLQDLHLSGEALKTIIGRYTMESGVRGLERELAKIVRKAVRAQVEHPERKKPVRITAGNLPNFLGKPKISRELFYNDQPPGLAYGMAWTEMGGKLLPVETSYFPGSGNLVLTGSLGDVMKESARIGLTLVRNRSVELGLTKIEFEKTDLHIHVPAGAIPKDGPSAGVTMTASLISALSQKAIRPGIAMTGEITLTGRILPVGGIKEKILAAHRNQLYQILLPKENERDLDDLPQEVRRDLKIDCIETLEEALRLLGLEG